ncbi:MAG TPA: hypothetical protein VFV30_07660, partial [Novosphingobium sp.]|nr:hypothetical protein [Novosphingobium sp.]
LRLGGQDLALRREGNTWRGESRVENARMQGGLSLRGVRQPGQMLITRHANGKRFFTILGQAEAAAPAKTGGRLRIYWDRSRSHQGKAAADEAEALVALAEQTRPEAIDLVTFASNAPQVTTLADAAALREALGKVTYRGATSLAGLDNLKLPDARRCVLVSDGQVTLDRAAPFRPDCRLSTLSADSGADGARLGRLAQRQGGQFVRIAPGKGREAATALSDSGVSVIAVTSEASGRIGWRAFSQADGGWMVVGEMPFDTRLPSAAPVTVRVVSPSGRISEESFAPDMAALPLDAGGALWAATRVGELADDPAQHEAMVALSRAFQVASPAMAFLVLETPEQYLNADIAPPRGFPEEWMEEYKEAKTSRDEDKQTARADRLETVLELWGERKAWWNTRFPLPRSKGGANGQQEAVPVGAPPPPPSPPPPPVLNRPSLESRETVSETAEEESGGNDVLVVTGTRISNPGLQSATPVSAVSGQDLDAQVEIKLETVLADRPYLKALDAAAPEARLRVLAEQEAEYGSVPAFYFDTADWFRLKGDAATARELMLSALELDKADNETLQIVAFRLERDGEYDLAVQLAERLAVGAKFLPQPRRALALALAARGTAAGKNGRADLERAFALLVEVALEPTDSGEYDGLEVIALMEANALIPRIEALGGTWKLDRRLVGLFDTDARIVIEWTADDADIDLWVDEPGGERVMYSNKQSDFGGQISNDMTDGYGPEEYAIRRAPKGEYRVRVNGYDADRINPNGPGHVLVRLIRNHGRRSEKAVLVDVDLSFQEGPNRDQAEKTRPIAVMTVN